MTPSGITADRDAFRAGFRLVPTTWDEALVWDDRIARLDTREAVRLTVVEVVA